VSIEEGRGRSRKDLALDDDLDHNLDVDGDVTAT
jgi:hypothetical protein